MLIRALVGADRAEWRRMCPSLWTGDASHPREIDALLESRASPAVACLDERDAQDELCAFLERPPRSYAGGCRSSPVPYIEGWYLDSALRRRGVGETLLEGAEEWARERGHTEPASDTGPGNDVSLAADKRLGFVITDRVVCFRKGLGEG